MNEQQCVTFTRNSFVLKVDHLPIETLHGSFIVPVHCMLHVTIFVSLNVTLFVLFGIIFLILFVCFAT